jgi:carbonic anhydrase
MFYNLRQVFFRTALPLLTVKKLSPLFSMPSHRQCHSKPNLEINRLIRGHEDFRAYYFNNPQNSLYENLVKKGQSPKTMVIACSDSRVDPSIILNSAPGELFVVRNVANLVPPFDNDPKHHGTSAALEFAVQTLKVENIIVLGHSHCGGIHALLKEEDKPKLPKPPSFIGSWMSIAKQAKEKTLATCKDYPIEYQEKVCEEHALATSLNNLLSFPWIAEKVNLGLLSLHAWRFDLTSGRIQQLNTQSEKFEDLEAVPEKPYRPS